MRKIHMPDCDALLARLDAIGQSLEKSGHALALIGLGSVGVEVERLDEYSDLDFFAIVEEGYKSRYIDNLDWLRSLCPIAYHFRNSADGYKLLFQDDIFCEFAVFEQSELRTIPFAKGRVIWKQPHIEGTIGVPVAASAPARQPDVEFLIGEALTNLYVGLGRFRRGEKLSAARFIQQYAVDRIVALAPLLEKEQGASKDDFSSERRFEQRFPVIAQSLPRFILGYEHSVESALAILAFLEQHFDVNRAIADAIRHLSQVN
jgi:lincosamide nucleotidyltransferase B/F